MKWVHLMLFGGSVQFRGRVRDLRPVWQMILIFPVWLVYTACRAVVDFADKRL